jgi:hypothetical protein
MITLATLQVALFDTVGVWAKKKTSQTASGTERGRNRKKNNHCLLSTLVYNVIQKNVNVLLIFCSGFTGCWRRSKVWPRTGRWWWGKATMSVLVIFTWQQIVISDFNQQLTPHLSCSHQNMKITQIQKKNLEHDLNLFLYESEWT